MRRKGFRLQFRVDVYKRQHAPRATTPNASAAALATLTPLASAVAQSIAADGVAPGNITLTARNAGDGPNIFVYVK